MKSEILAGHGLRIDSDDARAYLERLRSSPSDNERYHARELHLRPEEFVGLSLIDQRMLLSRGLELFVLEGSVELGNGIVESEKSLGFLIALRHATALGLGVRWTLAINGIELREATSFFHLTPPDKALNADASAILSAWRRTFQFGLLLMREGPGFLKVYDGRDPNEKCVLTIDDPLTAKVMRLAARVIVRSALMDQTSEAAVGDLERERLVLSWHGRSIALPFRVEHWPTSYVAF